MENKNMFNTVEEYESYLDELYTLITAKMESCQAEKEYRSFSTDDGKISPEYIRWHTAESAFLEVMALFTTVERKQRRNKK